MINKIIIYIFFIILFFKINQSLISDITPLSGFSSYTKNKIYTDKNQCAFSKLFLCNNEDANPCNILSNIGTINFVLSNSSGLIFGYQLNVNHGEKQEVILEDGSKNYTFTLDCSIFDIGKFLGFQLIGDYYRYPNFLTNGLSIYGIFRLVGIDPNSQIDATGISFNISLEGSKITYMESNIYSFNYEYFHSDFNFLDQIRVDISNSTNTRTFLLESLFKNNINSVVSIDNIQTFPNYVNINAIGYNQGPVLKFTTNTTSNESFFLVTKNDTNTGYMIYPIYGNQSSTTFLFPFNDFSKYYYTIFLKNKNVFQDKHTSFGVDPVQYYFDKPILDISLSTSFTFYSYNEPIVNYQIKNKKRYTQTKMNVGVLGKVIEKYFPYGFLNKEDGDNNNFNYGVSTLLLPYNIMNSVAFKTMYFSSQVDNSISTQLTLFNMNSETYDSNLSPKINSIQVVNLVSNYYLYRINASIPYKLLYFTINDKKYGLETLISGTPSDGIFEISTKSFYFIGFLTDSFGYRLTFNNYQVMKNSDDYLYLFHPPYYNYIDIYSISNVSFLYNDIDISYHRHYNVFYFNYSNIPKDNPFVLVPYGGEFSQSSISFDSDTLYKNTFYSVWNETLNLFQIEFYIEANIEIGDFQFVLYYGSINSIQSKLLKTQLRIINSQMDFQGPIIKKMEKNSLYRINNKSLFGIDWNMTIEDPINGFDNGYITIRGDIDLSVYNITFNSNDLISGDIFSGIYRFMINITYPCISQSYYITEMSLFDKLQRVSYFSLYSVSSSYTAVINPFLELLEDDQVNKFNLVCTPDPTASIDITAPNLTRFTPIFDYLTDGEMSFNFSAQDLESGLKQYQYPIVYLGTIDNEILECKSSIVFINDTNADYSCRVSLTTAFKNSGNIIYSIYGLINNNGLYRGYSASELRAFNFTYLGMGGLSFMNSDRPFISNYYRITENGGDLWLFGEGFKIGLSVYFIFDDISIHTSPSQVYKTSILIKDVKATNKPYLVYIVSSSGSYKSNNFTIIPTIFDYFYEKPSVSSSDSSNDSSTTPIPTNSPQSCPGNPMCGGPSNGKCIDNQGCVCISPWIGNDCLSQIIIVDPPKINNTDPSTEIIIPGNGNNNGSLPNVSYKSLISLVSIREIDIKGNEILNIPFNYWVFKRLDDLTYSYNTSLNIRKNNIETITNVTVTLKWFTNETTITFANEQLLMHASTMKYTVSITQYAFDNKLNNLQLVMSATIQSNTTDDICSLKEYGETSSGDNSNYLKIQVDNHSLYGRFIRRGIVDSSIRSVSNTLLDSQMKPITNTKTLQSFIGIQIPNYKESVTLDPDFSVLVDSYSASSKSNSICSKNSKLSPGKIAGIVIGCIAFVSIVGIAIVYAIIKRRKHKKFMSNVNQKMKQMNNDKL